MKSKFTIIVLIICLYALMACSDYDRSRKTLESAGFTDIVITGYEPFSCSDDDTYSTGFNAKNPKGVVVDGVVCCGVVKACTIRY